MVKRKCRHLSIPKKEIQYSATAGPKQVSPLPVSENKHTALGRTWPKEEEMT